LVGGTERELEGGGGLYEDEDRPSARSSWLLHTAINEYTFSHGEKQNKKGPFGRVEDKEGGIDEEIYLVCVVLLHQHQQQHQTKWKKKKKMPNNFKPKIRP
jgi:hypothetical protein